MARENTRGNKTGGRNSKGQKKKRYVGEIIGKEDHYPCDSLSPWRLQEKAKTITRLTLLEKGIRRRAIDRAPHVPKNEKSRKRVFWAEKKTPPKNGVGPDRRLRETKRE